MKRRSILTMLPWQTPRGSQRWTTDLSTDTWSKLIGPYGVLGMAGASAFSKPLMSSHSNPAPINIETVTVSPDIQVEEMKTKAVKSTAAVSGLSTLVWILLEMADCLERVLGRHGRLLYHSPRPDTRMTEDDIVEWERLRFVKEIAESRALAAQEREWGVKSAIAGSVTLAVVVMVVFLAVAVYRGFTQAQEQAQSADSETGKAESGVVDGDQGEMRDQVEEGQMHTRVEGAERGLISRIIASSALIGNQALCAFTVFVHRLYSGITMTSIGISVAVLTLIGLPVPFLLFLEHFEINVWTVRGFTKRLTSFPPRFCYFLNILLNVMVSVFRFPLLLIGGFQCIVGLALLGPFMPKHIRDARSECISTLGQRLKADYNGLVDLISEDFNAYKSVDEE